ncbi:hypothetical protein [Acuticoccus kandeliae]|nr:hypothetical protein [Acuticoccus kandeliae]
MGGWSRVRWVVLRVTRIFPQDAPNWLIDRQFARTDNYLDEFVGSKKEE